MCLNNNAFVLGLGRICVGIGRHLLYNRDTFVGIGTKLGWDKDILAEIRIFMQR